MHTYKRNASASNYHIASARIGRKTTRSIPRELVPWLAFIAVFGALAAFVWLVLVPASDAAVADAWANLEASGVIVNA